MKKSNKSSTFAALKSLKTAVDESLLPHNESEHPKKGVFDFYRHNPDTLLKAVRRMRPPSEPKINKENPKEWFIYWNHDVPFELQKFHKRKRKRIKVYDDINNYRGAMTRDDYAELRRLVWWHLIDVERYSPFEGELNEYRRLQSDITIAEEKIVEAEAMTQEKGRMDIPIDQALSIFIKSRINRKLARASISSYQGSVDWILEGLSYCGHGNLPIGKVKHIHLSEALDYIAEEREWSATTINKEIGFLQAIFNWLEIEDYVIKNPSRGKFQNLPTNKSKHRWYDPETKRKVKEELVRAGKLKVLYAMAFTYFTMIRSKAELRKLRIGDLDRKLKRIRFTPELSKNKKEQYRQWDPQFDQYLDEMKLQGLPQEWYVFGGGDGSPGPTMCGHNYFSKQFKVVKDRLELSPDFTIYGMKHTRIVHELMKGTEGKDITYMARHSDYKTTTDYMRDYDLTLDYVYGPEDLTF